MSGFGHDDVIEVLDSEIPDSIVLACWVDPISVQWEIRDGSNQAEPLGQVELGSGVDLDIEVVNIEVGSFLGYQVVAGRVLENQVVDFEVG